MFFFLANGNGPSVGLYLPLFAISQRLPCGAVTKGAASGGKRCTSFGFGFRLGFGGFGSDVRLRYTSVDLVRIFGFGSAGKVQT